MTDITNTPIGITQFDPSLGSLVSVNLILNWNGTTSITVQNSAVSASSGSASTKVVVKNSDLTSSANFTNTNNLFLPDSSLDGSVNTYTLASGASTTLGPFTNSLTQNHTYNSGSTNGPTILSEFTGTGTKTIFATTTTTTVLENTGGASTEGQTTFIEIDGQVTYNYSSTPEPTTMGLMGSALISLGVFAKKFAKRRG